jgi:hypothetical protein
MNSQKKNVTNFFWLGMLTPSCLWGHKKLVTSTDCLTTIDPSLMPQYRIFVTTDSSDRGSGTILSFGPSYALTWPVAYDSRSFKRAELNYPVHKEELLAIIRALSKWCTDLLGHHFKIWTDHKTLEHFETLMKGSVWWPFLIASRMLLSSLSLDDMLHAWEEENIDEMFWNVDSGKWERASASAPPMPLPAQVPSLVLNWTTSSTTHFWFTLWLNCNWFYCLWTMVSTLLLPSPTNLDLISKLFPPSLPSSLNNLLKSFLTNGTVKMAYLWILSLTMTNFSCHVFGRHCTL